MKYIVMLGDGMADFPLDELNGRTPLEAANKPMMDYLAQHGALGMCKTIPEGMPPGSDVANMSVLGFDPKRYYTGRSPLEAVALGIDLQPDDVAFRCNLVTLSDEADYADKTMVDYSAGEISTEEATILINYLAEHLQEEGFTLYAGMSYRHCFVKQHSQTGSQLTPPHDISGKVVGQHLPGGRYGAQLKGLMERSYQLLKDHPVNRARIARGQNPANSCWIWGEGTRPMLDKMEDVYGVKGGMVCAVDLLKGIATCAGMQLIDVPGATGGMVTNYRGKAEAAFELLFKQGCDLVYIHVEAPDECGHHGETQMKIDAIEAIDKEMLEWMMAKLDEAGEAYRILLCPDHPTPVPIRTHTADAIPFVLYDSTRTAGPNGACYTENEAKASGLFLSEGPMMMAKLVKGDF